MHAITQTGISNVRILDVENQTLSEPSDIYFRGDQIEKIEAHDPGNADQLFDGGGKIACPGLIDGHVHVLANSADLGTLPTQAGSYVTATAIASMQASLRRGFTTLRDAGGADFGLAQAAEEGLFTAPRLFFGGRALSQTGGHADMRKPGQAGLDQHQCCPHIGHVCDGVDEVRKAVREQLRTGAHHIKLMLSGGVASPTDRVDSLQFSDGEITAAIEEAEAAGRYVLAHAYTAKAVNRGLRLGVRSIEHGNLIDEESVQLFVEHDAFLVPTLVTYNQLKAEGAEYGLPPASVAKVDDVLSHGLAALKMAHEGGVKIVFGSDLLGGMQPHQSDEFRIRAAVQPNHAVLQSATTVAADLLGEEGKLGIIAEGAAADVLLLNGNPLEDIEVLAEAEQGISDVFVRGGLVQG